MKLARKWGATTFAIVKVQAQNYGQYKAAQLAAKWENESTMPRIRKPIKVRE
jgi:hypothetical protein